MVDRKQIIPALTKAVKRVEVDIKSDITFTLINQSEGRREYVVGNDDEGRTLLWEIGKSLWNKDWLPDSERVSREHLRWIFTRV